MMHATSGGSRGGRARRRWGPALFAVVLLVTTWPALAGAIPKSTTVRASVASDGGEGGSPSRDSCVSSDGRHVAFESAASDLVAGDTLSKTDVFVHDTQTGATTRVSVASDGSEGDGHSGDPAISADGRFVAFTSKATNLVSGDGLGLEDVFVHDTQTGKTTRVSVASDGSEGNGISTSPAISADGRYVAFDSSAANLVSGDTNGVWDVFVHDTQTGKTTRVNVASDGSEAEGGGSYDPVVAADGRCVAFWSKAPGLVPGDGNGLGDVFVRDMRNGTTSRVSVASDGSEGNGQSSYPAISENGRHVAFESGAPDLVPDDGNGFLDIFVHDRWAMTTTRVSVANDGGESEDNSWGPTISADGRLVAFESGADNLVSGETHLGRDAFLRDTQTGVTTRVSVASDGSGGQDDSRKPCISADGSHVAFQSDAENLVLGDANGVSDIFLRNALPSGLTAVEIAGPTRYETAIAASQGSFMNGADTVVIATGENWPDALGGAALAGAYDAPILLTLTSVLPDAVVNEIDRLGATDAIILGGPGAVSPAVETALASTLGAAGVRRIGGATRYDTADLIARAVETESGSAYDGTCFVATGLNFPDALAGSPLAAAGPWPILLAPATGMTPSTLATMDDIGVTDVLVLGGTGAVSQTIGDGLAGRVSGGVTRLAGPTRYETAIAVATYGVEDAFLRWNEVALATGENFPDALAGGPLQGRSGSVMLLTHTAMLTASTGAALGDNQDAIAMVRFLGGTGAVSQGVRDQVTQALE